MKLNPETEVHRGEQMKYSKCRQCSARDRVGAKYNMSRLCI